MARLAGIAHLEEWKEWKEWREATWAKEIRSYQMRRWLLSDKILTHLQRITAAEWRAPGRGVDVTLCLSLVDVDDGSLLRVWTVQRYRSSVAFEAMNRAFVLCTREVNERPTSRLVAKIFL